MLKVMLSVYQLLLLVAAAPLLVGVIKKTKAFFQSRQGPSIWQPYYDLSKLMNKESVISEHASWIFRITPYIYLGSMLVIAFLVPVASTGGGGAFTGDIILIIYLLALARFFLALAGLDAGSAFGGMASSREAALSSVAEPAMMLPLFTMALAAGTTNLTAIVAGVAQAGFAVLTPTHLMSLGALFVVAIAETGRIPVDNPDTHLELTMIHEGMLLEYSGKPLALLTLGAALKQIVIFALVANIFFPWGIALDSGLGSIAVGTGVFILKVFVLGIIMAIIETSLGKMRLFKVPDLLTGAFLLGLLGLITNFLLRR
ncbi:MAG: respiratory chain complex I subunit 1 family protein [Desulfitobacteriaceae bacterium]